MEHHRAAGKAAYQPVPYIIGAFLITWASIFALESTYLFGYEMPDIVAVFLDFLKSAAPFIVALFLLRKRMTEKGFLTRYIFGEGSKTVHYAIAAAMFAMQFFTFYCFRPAAAVVTAPIFFATFVSQLLFGGGMEEGGWRGYLFPALRTKMPVLVASIVTSVIWTLWHLPYFIIPASRQYGASLLAYMFITVMLGFQLSAIYMLSKSVFLCTLFHAFNNTVVMTMEADMGNLSLLLANAAVSSIGAVICLIISARQKKAANKASPTT